MADTEWTSPRKMMDYYMDQSDGIEACKKRLYLAVIKGELRARLKGRVLGPEWLKQIAAMKYDEDPLRCRPTLNCRFKTRRNFGRCNFHRRKIVLEEKRNPQRIGSPGASKPQPRIANTA